MSNATLASKTFDSSDQVFFAGLSGDFNPIHMDPLAARRTQAGAAVVHGMHAVLWSLDRLVELGVVRGGIAGLKVQFSKFIPVGSEVSLELRRRDDKSIRAELTLGSLTTTVLNLSLGKVKAGSGSVLPLESPEIGPADRAAELVEPEAAAGVSGRMDIAGPARWVEERFPHAAAALGSGRIAALALLSRLVGMICPGLHSIFGAFAIDLIETPQRRDGLWFSVNGTDDRFRMIRMAVNGAGIDGSVQTFLRWPPVAQASMSDIAKLVSPTEFAGTIALVVGGSRGLGALTAKVVSAGGGEVVASYATGRQEAEQLAEEICSHVSRDTCRIIPYDARRGAADQLKKLARDPSHLYYFATTPIARQKQELFVPALFDEFIQVYVKGFYDCCRVLGERTARPLIAFYPSSVFVDDGPTDMAEYSMAKIAGENLCNSMNRSIGRVQVIVGRLPRLRTDQTATVPPVESSDPLEVMLPIIRKVQSSGSGS
jgi:acyl dehydratase/NAD(P)-dependent dehydrogenase (short-subunit alcohol dehydrogenase family)